MFAAADAMRCHAARFAAIRLMLLPPRHAALPFTPVMMFCAITRLRAMRLYFLFDARRSIREPRRLLLPPYHTLMLRACCYAPCRQQYAMRARARAVIRYAMHARCRLMLLRA